MKRIGIVGAGRFGEALAENLARQGAEVILLDFNRNTVQRMSTLVSKAVQGDGTNPNILEEAGFKDCDAAVVAIGTNMEGNILTTMNLKELKVPYVVAKAVSDTHGKVLERVGADLVIYPDRERAQRLARSLVAGVAVDYFEITEGVSVVEMKAPSQFIGKTLLETKIRQSHGVTVLAIKREPDDGRTAKNIISPTGDDIIEEGDTLVIFGQDKKLEALSS